MEIPACDPRVWTAPEKAAPRVVQGWSWEKSIIFPPFCFSLSVSGLFLSLLLHRTPFPSLPASLLLLLLRRSGPWGPQRHQADSGLGLTHAFFLSFCETEEAFRRPLTTL